MAKAVMTIGGYVHFVMDVKAAAQVMEVLGGAEKYETKYRKAEEGGTTQHIYPADIEAVTLKLISDDLYRMAKLAGKPE